MDIHLKRSLPNNTNRNCGIDALRIISMLMVTSLHVLGKGGFINSSNDSVKNISIIIFVFSRVAVNCYILISGYFLSQKSFKLSRITSIYSQVWFYSAFSFLFAMFIHCVSFTKGMFVKSLFPFLFQNYWFATYYILLLFIAPLLNSSIMNMSRSKYRMVLLVLIGFFVVYNNIILPINPLTDNDGFSLSLFLIVYCVAGYIRKFYTPNGKWQKYLLGYLGISLLALVLHYLLKPYGEFYSSDLLFGYKGILCFSASICLFLTFLNLNIKNKVISKIVLFVAPLTFAVYLIHESLSFKVYLWELINPTTVNASGWQFLLIILLIIVLIFIICIIIEFFRQRIFSVLKLDSIIKLISDKIENKIRKDFTKESNNSF